ncbi:MULTISPECIES: hypothetical protein [Aeromonas]|nr:MULTISPECIES: hypothetical protein [Aeromonas]
MHQQFIDDIADEVIAILATTMSKRNKAKQIIPVLNRLEEIGL